MTPGLVTVWRPEAVDESLAAAEYYDEKRVGLGSEYLACVTEAVGRAKRQPRSFVKVDGEVRRVLTRRFPYGVFFLIENDRIVVLAVGHVRQAPGLWKRKAEA